MAEARVILLLVSADFLASDHLYDVELERALSAAPRREGAHVLGVLLRPGDWEHGKLQRPRDAAQARARDERRGQGGAGDRVAEPRRGVRARSPRRSARPAQGVGVRRSRISVNPSEAHLLPAPRG